MSIAFDLVFRKGQSPQSCPSPDNVDLHNRIREKVQNESPAMGGDALMRIQHLWHDDYEIYNAFREGEYGSGDSRAVEVEAQNAGASKSGCPLFEDFY